MRTVLDSPTQGTLFLVWTTLVMFVLRFNAGPLEKAQESIPLVGDVLGLLTDRIVTYHVTGTWSKPKFDVRPLGLGANAEK